MEERIKHSIKALEALGQEVEITEIGKIIVYEDGVVTLETFSLKKFAKYVGNEIDRYLVAMG